MEWAVGVTTVPERSCVLLPVTIESLRRGGFRDIRLFVDGECDPSSYAHFGLPCTFRNPRIRAWGNWWLGFQELYIRQPHADRYAIFQDDIICVKNLRQYLESSPYPVNAYCNLILYSGNYEEGRKGWYRAPSRGGWRGLGAQGLVFDQHASMTLLSKELTDFTCKPKDPARGHQAVDGAIVSKLETFGVMEYVHGPGLITHTGDESTMGHPRQSISDSFPGEEFDAMSLLS